MAVTTKGLCATIALICVIVPMIVGHVMPTGTEEKTIYESDNFVNITSDIVNESQIVYYEDTSDFNNVPFLATTPVSITENNTPIRALNSTYFQVYSLDPFDITDSYDMKYYYFSVDPENQRFNFTYNTESYAATGILYVKDRSLFIAYGDFGVLTLHDNYPTITPSARYAGFSYNYLISPVEYIQPSEGAYTGVYSGDQMKTPKFSNGYLNSRVGFNIERLLTSSHSQVYSVFDEDSKIDITLSYGGSGWILSNGTDSVTVGDFKQIFLDFDAKNNEVRISSLARSDFIANPYPRFIKTYTIPLSNGSPLDGIEAVMLNQTTVQKAARIYCYSADIPSGTQGYINDKTVNLANYYPGESVIVDMNGQAFYGDSVTFPGIGTVDVDQGRITFDDVTGEERTVKLRDSTIAATYDEETQLYTVALNGYTIAEEVSAADLKFIFNGKWLFTMMIAPLMPRIVDEYVFNFATLNITMQEYALIGVITSLLAFVGCALIGKRSGQKVIPLLLISGLGFMIYVAMLL